MLKDIFIKHENEASEINIAMHGRYNSVLFTVDSLSLLYILFIS